jgi:glyoxylase-like metal-dependent hydrolase (beta-lactamase superfamily II)
VKAVGLSADVFVVTSRIWQTTCTLIRSGEEAFVVDSPVLPDELELLPAVAEQAGFRMVGRLATHADWDHLLAGYAFPDAPLGVPEASASRLGDGSAQRRLREFDDEHYVERPGPLMLPAPQTLPVPGRIGIGEEELECHLATGHTEDGMALWAPWAGVLVCGDYLSPVEIPMVRERGAYLETLDRLEPLVSVAAWVVPGHGSFMDSERALAVLREDRAYVSGLPSVDAPLPLARRSGEQRKIHLENVARLGNGAG